MASKAFPAGLTVSFVRRLGLSGPVAAALAGMALWAGPSAAVAAIPEYRGVNSFGAYGYDTQSFKSSPGGAMKDWGINMVRMVVPEFDRIPLGFGTVKSSDNKSTLWGLQGVVNDVKANVGQSAVTILCPFTWQAQEVLSKVPSSMPYFDAYKTRLAAMATQFGSQSNVWLEVWNEPYTANNSSTWLDDMKSMVTSMRTNTGFTGKIVIPGGNYSGNEAPILTHGKTLVDFDPLHNIVFDLHAYSNFIENRSATDIANRIQTIKNTGVDFIFGEFGPQILGTNNTEDVSAFITAVKQKGITALAWNWSDDDANTIHNDNGSLNNTAANYNWANQVLAYTRGAPAVPEPTAAVAMGAVTVLLGLRRRSA